MAATNASARDEALFASIELSPIATVITNPWLADNPIVAANEAFAALTGYARSEILGRNCRFLGGAGTEEAGRALLGSAVKAKRPVLAELTNYRRDGTPFRNAVMIAPLLDEKGELAWFVGSQMDVGDGARLDSFRRPEAERRLERLTQRQREVLGYMLGGYRNKQIAGFLGIGEKTVKMHRKNMLLNLGAPSSADAIRIGVEAGLQLSESRPS